MMGIAMMVVCWMIAIDVVAMVIDTKDDTTNDHEGQRADV